MYLGLEVGGLLQLLLRRHLPLLLLDLLEADQLDVKEQRGAARDLRRRARGPVGVVGAALEDRLLAHLHARKALVPRLDHLPHADLERELAPAVARGVELGAVRLERARVVRPHVVALRRRLGALVCKGGGGGGRVVGGGRWVVGGGRSTRSCTGRLRDLLEHAAVAADINPLGTLHGSHGSFSCSARPRRVSRRCTWMFLDHSVLSVECFSPQILNHRDSRSPLNVWFKNISIKTNENHHFLFLVYFCLVAVFVYIAGDGDGGGGLFWYHFI